MIRLREDATEKQAGEYILDKQYIVALSDKAFETTEKILYDLNILTDQDFVELYSDVEDLHHRILSLLATKPSPHPSEAEDAEEPEYKLLRAVRETLFHSADSDLQDRESTAPTLYSIVQKAQEAAGDSLARLARTLGPPQSTIAVVGNSNASIQALVVDLMHCLSAPNKPLQICDPASVNSSPMSEFLSSFSKQESLGNLPENPAASESARLAAIVLEDSISTAIFHKEGFILVDAYVSCVADLNYVYCRFSSSLESERDSFVFSTPAAEIFARLGFSVARTRRGVTGWNASQSLRETSSKLRAIGRMAAYLFPPASAGIQPGEKGKSVSHFFQIQD